jgi:hypothetical protein
MKDMLIKVSSFTYATALDLVMGGYYNIRLSNKMQTNFARPPHH